MLFMPWILIGSLVKQLVAAIHGFHKHEVNGRGHSEFLFLASSPLSFEVGASSLAGTCAWHLLLPVLVPQ
jgi:hypothetical protein